MHKTIDAKILFINPSASDRERINSLISGELCEAFILDDLELATKLISSLDKSILVIDERTFPGDKPAGQVLESLFGCCGDRLLKIFTIGTFSDLPENGKIYRVDTPTVLNDDKILAIIDELGLWGSRSYIRFGDHNSRVAFFRMRFGNFWRTGVIHDISASGMSCSFDRFDDIEVEEKSTEIEIYIRESIFRLKGNFLLRRSFKKSNTFVIVFSDRRSGTHINKLNSIIYNLTREQVLTIMEKLA